MKVTLDGIKAKIKGETYLVLPDGRTTLCILDLENGYTIKGLSACVDPAEFNLDLGRKYAFEDAFKQIWALEGYLLAEKMYGRQALAAPEPTPSVTKVTSTAPYGLKKDGTLKKKPGRKTK